MSEIGTSSASLCVFVVGTRAQLIKVAPVVVACERRGLPACLLMTGQHKETMQDLIGEFGIKSPQIDAYPTTERATVAALIRWVPGAYMGVKAQLSRLQVQHGRLNVLVHGDTLSTVLGAVAAKRAGARVVHLESGLTSEKLFDPFPEELSRRIVFRFADVAMCPNDESASHMQRYIHCEVVNTCGNTIVDAVSLTGAARKASAQTQYIVASLHRFQNIYDTGRLRALVRMLQATASHCPIHFVLHPATRKRLEKTGLYQQLEKTDGIKLSPRLGYGDFLRLVANAVCVLTDGGSNQEELATLGVPTIVMRKATERPDGLGSNAIMEGDVPLPMARYLQEGLFQSLQTAPALYRAPGPSQRTVDWLVANTA